MENQLIARERKNEIITIANSLNPKNPKLDPRALRRLLSLRITLGLKAHEISNAALTTLIRRCPHTRNLLQDTYTYQHTSHLTLKDLRVILKV